MSIQSYKRQSSTHDMNMSRPILGSPAILAAFSLSFTRFSAVELPDPEDKPVSMGKAIFELKK